MRDYSGVKRSGGRAPSLKVKLSDFGNSFRVSQSGAYHDDFELQTLSYRAPEVLYGLPFDTQIDMWSLGCLLVEVFIGRRLFDAFNRSSAVATMAKTLGPIPRQCFAAGHFYPVLSSLPVYGTLSLDDNGQQTSSAYSQPLSARLAALLHCEEAEHHTFVSFLAGCLAYDPRHRLTPLAALRHPFVMELCPLAHFLSQDTPPPTAPSTLHTDPLLPRTITPAWLKVEPASAQGASRVTGHALDLEFSRVVRGAEDEDEVDEGCGAREEAPQHRGDNAHARHSKAPHPTDSKPLHGEGGLQGVGGQFPFSVSKYSCSRYMASDGLQGRHTDETLSRLVQLAETKNP